MKNDRNSFKVKLLVCHQPLFQVTRYLLVFGSPFLLKFAFMIDLLCIVRWSNSKLNLSFKLAVINCTTLSRNRSSFNRSVFKFLNIDDKFWFQAPGPFSGPACPGSPQPSICVASNFLLCKTVFVLVFLSGCLAWCHMSWFPYFWGKVLPLFDLALTILSWCSR